MNLAALPVGKFFQVDVELGLEPSFVNSSAARPPEIFD
jgi:hypothetical protein